MPTTQRPCEATSRPNMRFVPVKSIEQQGVMAVHRVREGIKEERTASINRIRGLLAEFGLVFPQSPKALRQVLPAVLEGASNEMGGVPRKTIAARGLRLQDRAPWLWPDKKPESSCLRAPGPGRHRRPISQPVSQPCFLSKNCSSSVEPFSAAVEDSASIVVVTASK